jgi:hypothetical protein
MRFERRAMGWIVKSLRVACVALAIGVPLAAAPTQRPAADAPRDVVRPRPQVPVRPPAPNNVAPTRPPIADALEGVLANGLRRRLRLDDAQLDRIRPALRSSLERRNRLAQESIRTREELSRAVQEERSEGEIEGLIARLDETNRQLREAREDFFRSVDPELSPRQRALLRNELPNLEEQIRNLIEQSRRGQR